MDFGMAHSQLTFPRAFPLLNVKYGYQFPLRNLGDFLPNSANSITQILQREILVSCVIRHYFSNVLKLLCTLFSCVKTLLNLK